MNDYIPFLFQVIAGIGFVGIVLVFSVLLGKRAGNTGYKSQPYECGMLPIGNGAPQFSIKFYVVAMMFLIFDIEVVFMYPWAVIFRDFVMENSAAFWTMAAFIGILLVAYLYAWRKGALTWTRRVGN